jgi:hypothetical protein
MNTSQDATVMLRVLLLALLGILWSELARAHAQSEATAPATQYVWTGMRDGAQRVKPGELAGYAAQLERDLAKLQVAREVDGPAVDSRGGLRDLLVRAALANEYPRRWDMLAKIAAARAAEFERRGELALARRAADELLLSSAVRDELAAEKLVFELKAAPDELVRAASAAATPELVALRNRLDAQLRGASPGGRGSAQVVRSLEEAVDRALADEQPSFVVDLGARAAPALEALVRADFDALPSKASLDPLVLLFRVDEARGAAFALEHWNRGRLLWRKRVLRAMGEAAVLTNPGTWLLELPANQVHTRTPPTLVDTGWRELLGHAVKDEDVGLDSFEEIAKLATYDALDAPLQMGLIAKIERGGPAAWRAASKLFEAGRGRESLRPVLERVVNRREPELQVVAALELAYFPRSAVLLREFGSPTAAVRAAIAHSLVGKTQVPIYRPNASSSVLPAWLTDGPDSERPPLEAGDSAVVDALLGDAEEHVRAAALGGFLLSPVVVVDVARLVAIARDPSVDLRRRLVNSWSERRELIPAPVLEILARDADVRVLAGVSTRLDALLRSSDGRPVVQADLSARESSWRWSDEYVPALVAWVSNPAGEGLHLSPEVIAVACQKPDGVTALVHAALGRGSVAQGRVANGLAYNPERTAWSALSLEDAEALLRGGFGARVYKDVVRRLAYELPSTYQPALRGILLDRSAPNDLRGVCAAASTSTADAQWRAAVLEVFAGPDGVDAVSGLILRTQLPVEERDALLLQLLDVPGVDDKVVARFFGNLSGNHDMSEPLAVAVLEHIVATGSLEWSGVADSAVLCLKPTEARPFTELFERAYPYNLGSPILNRIARAQLDVHLPFLERVLLGNPPGGGTDTAENRKAAANALASYLDERAAAILLKGLAATTNKDVRDACFAALDSIRRYEDERERWATRKTSRAAREAAIAELVPMLADKDAAIRAQAARSLGALEAVEHLPALVRLLKDSNGDVRKAAQSAIDALTAPKPVTPAPTPAPTEPKRD